MNTEKNEASINRVGVIDIGTLKTKFVIAEFDENKGRKIIIRDKKITNLGKGLNSGSRIINPESLSLQQDVLVSMMQTMEALNVNAYSVIGTEALRNAENASEVIDLINTTVHQDLEILDQEQEARLFFEVVSRSISNQDLATVDIGGGSVQLCIGKDQNMRELHLLKTGTLSLQLGDVNSNSGIIQNENSWQFVKSVVSELNLSPMGNAYLVYGSTNILDFFSVANIGNEVSYLGEEHSRIASIEELIQIYNRITRLERNEREKFFPNDPQFMWGVDKGLINVANICEALGITEVIPTNLNLSDGILLKLSGN
ncbi:hypothetical protein HGA88_04105 [Candidatus Roizmanbacteria bacterium]|nr:hypothetical protein [Candidatus Roizmanbacteria bacterium]